MSMIYIGNLLKGVPEVADRVVGDRRIWNSKVNARTQDTDLYRFGFARVANPTSCLEIVYCALRLGVIPGGIVFRCTDLGTLPSFI